MHYAVAGFVIGGWAVTAGAIGGAALGVSMPGLGIGGATWSSLGPPAGTLTTAVVGQAPGVAADVMARGGGPNTGGFSTASEAAARALERATPQALRENSEYGGLVFRAGGRFYATNAVTNGSDQYVDVWGALEQVPEGAKIIGDYHIHTRETADPLLRGRWWRNGETFSGTDYRYLSDAEKALTPDTQLNQTDYFGAKLELGRADLKGRLESNSYTSYMRTPSGRLGVYNVQSDNIFYFSPSTRLTDRVPAASYAWH
jgi:hypothetical protein